MLTQYIVCDSIKSTKYRCLCVANNTEMATEKIELMKERCQKFYDNKD